MRKCGDPEKKVMMLGNAQLVCEACPSVDFTYMLHASLYSLLDYSLPDLFTSATRIHGEYELGDS